MLAAERVRRMVVMDVVWCVSCLPLPTQFCNTILHPNNSNADVRSRLPRLVLPALPPRPRLQPLSKMEETSLDFPRLKHPSASCTPLLVAPLC